MSKLSRLHIFRKAEIFFLKEESYKFIQSGGGSLILQSLTWILRFMRGKSKSVAQQRTTELKIKNILTEKVIFWHPDALLYV